MSYLVNTKLVEELKFTEEWYLDPYLFLKVAKYANSSWKLAWTSRHPFDPANYVPDRNISGGLGESFGAMLIKNDNRLIVNKHPDGYPDILPNNQDAKPWVFWPRIDGYFNGGFDMKSQQCHDFYIKSPSVSAHHRFTKKVMLVQWTYYNKMPFVLAVYYCNNLEEEDWGTPTMGKKGSKTTPACSTKDSGKRKLRHGWIIMHDGLEFKAQSPKKIQEQYGFDK